MEQVNSGMNDVNDLSDDSLQDKDKLDGEELAADQLAADLLREQAEGPVPFELATPGEGEDLVLLVEAISLPEEPETLSPEEQREEMSLDDGSPWYRSPRFYIGAGLIGGAALAAGAVFFSRSRKTRQQRTTLGRAQSILSQWSNQLSGQTSRLTEQASKLARQMNTFPRWSGSLGVRVNRLTDQATKFTSQAQDQISRLTGRRQKNALVLIPLQRQPSASKWRKQTQRQLSSIGSFIGTTSTQALNKTQEGLAQFKQGVASGAAKTGEGIQTGWKLSRTFTLGMVAGAVWAAIFTPESGETTRRHLSTIFQRGKTRN
jgi:hypothetical protein